MGANFLDGALRAERAKACNGLSYGDPATRERYLQHQYRGDRPADADSMGRSQSGCLLHLRGVLGDEHLDDDISFRGKIVDAFDGAYAEQIGMIEGLLQAWCAQRGGGIIRYTGEQTPDLEVGQLVVIGSGLATHGLIVTAIDGDQITSSDGGQTDPKNGGRPTAICERKRTLARINGLWCLGGRTLSWSWR